MHRDLLSILACPESGGDLDLEVLEERNGHVYAGALVSRANGKRYPIERFIPRFVPQSNYADNFGFQWNRFRQTQLDSYSGTTITADRFWAQSGWRPEDINGKRVLDVGCGAGRFAEVALDAGAKVVALDFSSAVDACLENHRQHLSHLDVIQGDIYHLPFKPAQFDFVYCFGVLQHTPNVYASFMALPVQVKSRGSLAVDVYRKHWTTMLQPKYWLRPLTTRMRRDKLFALVESWAPSLLATSSTLRAIPLIGKVLARPVPVANYSGVLPLSKEQLEAWAILDTFDWFGPAYDQPQTEQTMLSWGHESGLQDVEVLQLSHLTLRGKTP
jgi:ubiquinone/menaquinone biosynthesis C-methylase UbiE/uncharacterized protein YbaR (Trm112 family)